MGTSRAPLWLLATFVVASLTACTDPVSPDDASGPDSRLLPLEPQSAVSRGLIFHSDWSTGRGRTLPLLLDSAQATPWDFMIGNGKADRVVRGGPLGFPSDNVYASVAQYSSAGVVAENPRLLDDTLPDIAVGQSRFYRWYFRVAVPDSIDTTGGEPHPIQDAIAASDANWMFKFDVRNDGTWLPGFHFNFTPYPDNRYSLTQPLLKNRTYRFELMISRTGATTFQADARVYDAAGTRLYGPRAFRNANGLGTRSLVNEPALVLGNPSVIDELQVGNNGPSWTNVPRVVFPFHLWYTGAVAVCATNWCGPYRGREMP